MVKQIEGIDMNWTPSQICQIMLNHIQRNHPQMANYTRTTNGGWVPATSPTIRSNSVASGTIYVNNVNNTTNLVFTNSSNVISRNHVNKPASTRAIYELIANDLYNMQHLPIDNPEYPKLLDLTRLIAGTLKISDGEMCLLTLPDGARLRVETDGSYKLETQDAKVVYRANRVREFNPFINASDKLEDFIKYCGTLNVKQDEMLQLPLELFIMWLVLEAAKADQVEESEAPLLTSLKKVTKARCTSCGKFMKRILKQKGIGQCRPECFAIACA